MEKELSKQKTLKVPTDPGDLGEVVDTTKPEELINVATVVKKDFVERNSDQYLNLVNIGKMDPVE